MAGWLAVPPDDLQDPPYQCFALTEKSKNDEGGVPGILRRTGEDRQ